MIFRPTFVTDVPRVIVLAALLIGCGGGSEAAKSDPSQPAVVALPGPPLPKPPVVDTTLELPDRILVARRELAADYAVAAFAAVGADLRMLNMLYSPEVVLQMGDSTFRGAGAAIAELVQFSRRNSVARVDRTPLVTRFLKDSIVSDSGTLIIVSKRAGADTVIQRGSYSSLWRIRPEGNPWQFTADRLYLPRGVRVR
jgi:hypothetical protein